MYIHVPPGGSDGGGVEEGAGQQQHDGENEEEHGVNSERYKNNTDTGNDSTLEHMTVVDQRGHLMFL